MIVHQKLEAYLAPLATSRHSDITILRKTFRRVHRDFLRKYVAYSEFDRIFSAGEYDCLTATALFSHLLDGLHFRYEVVETNYHIFLVVQTSKGRILLETTDRFGGFVSGEDAILERMKTYQESDIRETSVNKFYYRYSFNLCQQISSANLVGLLYYNQSVKAFNQHDWVSSSVLLEKSHRLYPSRRCNEFGPILIQSILESSLNEKVKSDCVLRLRNFSVLESKTIASN